jgi:hypothetical protein
MGFERVLTPLGHVILVFAYALPPILPISRARAEPLNVVFTCIVSLVATRVRRIGALPNGDATSGHHHHQENQGESLD